MKPKYLEEIFSILSSIRTFPESLLQHKQSIGSKLQTLAKVWPKSRFYVNCKKQLLRLLKNWNIKVEFSKGNTKLASISNGDAIGDIEDDSNVTKKKKKKKKKSQEKLKNDKELKLQQAKAQENSDIPSFSELVQDTLNQEAVETSKRKATDEAVKPKKKKKK